MPAQMELAEAAGAAQPPASPASPAELAAADPSPEPDLSPEPDRAAAETAEAGSRTPEIPGYELLWLLGRDTHGETWIARKPGRRLLAVRVIYRAGFADDEAFSQMLRAVRAHEPASRADGNSVEILQSARADGFLFYITPLGDDLPMRRPLDPGSPESAIESYRPRSLKAALARSGAIPADECVRIGIYLTAGLETLHRLGRIHGSIRPARILFVNGDPKLREPDFEALSGNAGPVAADSYAAPEGAGNPQADIYSLGRVLAEISAGNEVADSPNAGRHPGAAPDKAMVAHWKRIVAKACAPNPAKRYATAQEFHDDLAALLARSTSGGSRWLPAKLPTLAAAAVLVIAAGFGAAHFLQQPARTQAPALSAESAPPPAPAEPPPVTLQVAPPPPAEPPKPAPLPVIAEMQPALPAEIAAVAPPAAVKPVAAEVMTPPAAAVVPPTEPPAVAQPLPPAIPAETKTVMVTAPRPPPPPAPSPTVPETAAPIPPPAAVETETPRAHSAAGEPWTNSLGMKFVPVGDVLFCIWTTRVKDYEAFCTATGNPRTRALYEDTGEHPVLQVSWHDAKAFCDWLTKKEIGEGALAKGRSYRLPTDLEWSMAVGLPAEKGRTPEGRDSGIKDIYPWGAAWPPPKGAGNFADTSAKGKGARIIPGYTDGFPHTAPVGSFAANRHGLFDMAGNVWQWCEDTYSPRGTRRVSRGGSWADDRPGELSSSYRNNALPDTRGLIYGFRCVLDGPQ